MNLSIKWLQFFWACLIHIQIRESVRPSKPPRRCTLSGRTCNWTFLRCSIALPKQWAWIAKEEVPAEALPCGSSCIASALWVAHGASRSSEKPARRTRKETPARRTKSQQEEQEKKSQQTNIAMAKPARITRKTYNAEVGAEVGPWRWGSSSAEMWHCTSSCLPSPASGLHRRSQANSTEKFQCWPSPAVPAPQVPFSRSTAGVSVTGAKCQTSFRAWPIGMPRSFANYLAKRFASLWPSLPRTLAPRSDLTHILICKLFFSCGAMLLRKQIEENNT